MTSIFSTKQYLDGPDIKADLLAYKYAGRDDSLYYKYFSRPLVYALLPYVPMSIAPNVITLAGFILVCISHVIMLYYMPDLDDPHGITPFWVFAYNAFSLIAYQTLDNMDGAQARRTGTSSPLGLIFDHGCDALNAVVGPMTLAASLQTGPTWKTWVIILNSVSGFFLNTWEEYYRGELVLPLINAPNEGLVAAAIMHLMTGVWGVGLWSQTIAMPIPPQLATLADALLSWMPLWKPLAPELSATGVITIQYNTTIVLLMTIIAFLTLSGNVFNVYRAIQSGHGHGLYNTSSYMVKRFPFYHALTRLGPLFALVLFANLWLAYSPVRIFWHYPRLCCWTIGLLFSKLVTHLMLAHLTAREYHPVRKTMVPMLFMGLHRGLHWISETTEVTAGGLLDEKTLLIEFFCLSVSSYLHMFLSVVWEMSKILEIPIFTVPKAKIENVKK
eukprot:PhM_4_TR5223/c3_g1_i1/m.54825/K00993/EPT1; ethanolaminephosphotransferase